MTAQNTNEMEMTAEQQDAAAAAANLLNGDFFPVRIYSSKDIAAAQKMYNEFKEYALGIGLGLAGNADIANPLIKHYADSAKDNFLCGAIAQAIYDVVNGK